MIKEYRHFGSIVYKQVIDSDFREELIKKSVSYIDLPILNVDVIKYENDGVARYAVIQNAVVPGEFCQKVYITEKIPDDCNWQNLIEDVDNQELGGSPMEMMSKLKAVLSAAEDLARENTENDIMSVISGVTIEDIGFALISLGYNKDKISKMSAHDVDDEFMKKIMDWFV